MDKNIGLLIQKISNQLKRKIEEEIKQESSLTKTQGMVLCFLFNHEKEIIYQKDIEEKFSIRRSTATEILNLMEQRNYIKRIPSTKDKRANIIIITEAGKKEERLARKKINQLENQIISSLTEKEQITLQKLLTKVEQNLIEREKKNDKTLNEIN